MNPIPSADGPGLAWQGFARRCAVSDHVSDANAPADLFQPVTSFEPPAAATTDKPVTKVFASPVPPSDDAPRMRRWAGLVAGTPGVVIGLAASAALVIVMAGMTMSTISSPTASPVAGTVPGPSPAPATPPIRDEPLVTVPPVEEPAEVAGQTPATASSPEPAAAPEASQPSPMVHHAAMAAQPASPPAPDHGPALPPSAPPPSAPPPSTAMPEDAGHWTFTPGSYPDPGDRSSQSEPCAGCDDAMRKMPRHEGRPSMADRQRERQARRAERQSTSTDQESKVREQSDVSEQGERDR
jgi:hypothetical protein